MEAALDAVLGTYPSWSHLVVRVALGVVALGIGCRAPAPDAQGIAVQTQMVKGPATAPVTIVEFSDYQ